MMVLRCRTAGLLLAGLMLPGFLGCSEAPAPSSSQSKGEPPAARPLNVHLIEPQTVVFAEAARDDKYLTLIYTRANSKEKYHTRVWLVNDDLAKIESAGKIRLIDDRSSEGFEAPCKIVDKSSLAYYKTDMDDLGQFMEITFVGIARKEGKLVLAGVQKGYKKFFLPRSTDEENINRIEASGKKILVVVRDAKYPEQDGRVFGEYLCKIAADWDELQILLLAN